VAQPKRSAGWVSEANKKPQKKRDHFLNRGDCDVASCRDLRRAQSSRFALGWATRGRAQIINAFGARMKGRAIFEGTATGRVLKSDAPLGFFGHLDPQTGIYKEHGHPLDGISIKGRILVFPRGKGSTVGSYILYGLKKAGNAPAAMIMAECDTIVATGALIGEIPTVDQIALVNFENEQLVRMAGAEVVVEESR
jgi:predicted aconitase with swiveling domain